MNAKGSRIHQNFHAFAAEEPSDFFCHIRILASHDLQARFDNRHAATEAQICLRQLDAGVTAAKHDQVWRHLVQLQRLDVGKRARVPQSGNIRNGGMRTDIDDNLLAVEQSHATVVQ